jgi:hypothetical protein
MMTADSRPAVRVYAKPIVVPARLGALSGPTAGVVDLPRHLKWSGNPRYDLDQPGRIADMYRTVLNEAATPADLHLFLDRSTLIALWPTMWLPLPLRQKWEKQFPELAARRADAAA